MGCKSSVERGHDSFTCGCVCSLENNYRISFCTMPYTSNLTLKPFYKSRGSRMHYDPMEKEQQMPARIQLNINSASHSSVFSSAMLKLTSLVLRQVYRSHCTCNSEKIMLHFTGKLHFQVTPVQLHATAILNVAVLDFTILLLLLSSEVRV